MHKYERQCWNCGSRDLEPMGDHVKCRSCGATWNYVPRPGDPGVLIDYADTGGGYRVHREKRFTPSGKVQRQAARARESRTTFKPPE